MQEYLYVLYMWIIWQVIFDNLVVMGISLIELVVIDEGDWFFNVIGMLDLNKGEKWDVILLVVWELREQIQKLGDWYFDWFGDVGRGDVLWYVEFCYWLEGGLLVRGMKKGEDCIYVMLGGIKVLYRWYVVDEEMGMVDVFMGFFGLDRMQGQVLMLDSYFFRVEGGKVRYCYIVSVCVERGCGIGEIEWLERRQRGMFLGGNMKDK